MIIYQNRKQRIKIENVSSEWQNSETGVLQGSILAPLLILDNTYFASYADDNTPPNINQNADTVTKTSGGTYLSHF